MFDYNSVGMTAHTYMLIAVPFTVLLGLQLIVTLTGLESAHDMAHPGDHHDGSHGFKLLTVRNLIAFFAMFGWTGLAMLSNGYNKSITFIVALLVGMVIALFISGMFYVFIKLARSDVMDYKSGVGKTASVYMPIPAKRMEYGKINVDLNGTVVEVKAITDNDEDIPTHATVKVLSVDNGIYLVEKA